MDRIFSNIDVPALAGVAILWMVVTILFYLYNNVLHPLVKVNSIDKLSKTVHLTISHNLDRFNIQLDSHPKTFEFEAVKYYWVAKHDDPNEVYTLNVEKKGRLKELLRIDFTNQITTQYAI